VILKANFTNIQEFLLIGLKDLNQFQIPVFMLFFTFYVATIAGNLLIIVLVSISQGCQSPMYFLLGHLSLCDILISTNVAPNTLKVIILGRSPISYHTCLIQMILFGGSAFIECCLLTVMSYDRFLAICSPLRYTSIMNQNRCCYLVLWTWITGFLFSVMAYLLVLVLQFCGPNIIDHFFCDLAPLLELSCSDTSALEIHVSVIASGMCVSQLIFVIITYVCIFISILKITPMSGRKKVFSTCSSHLIVVSIYYGTLITLYLAPARGYSLNLNKSLSLFNTIVTPLFNPLIYSLKNKEIRKATAKLFSKDSIQP
ncbi:hypothetical protein GDO86_018608, partial [Hymenochirus boettgeri]